MPLHIEQGRWQPERSATSLSSLLLRSREMEMVIVPERGAKIVSLRHLPTQTEWLWSNPYLQWQTPESPERHAELHDVGGWDECFPTVTSSTMNGISWPEQGDLWWRAWDAEVRGNEVWMGVEAYRYRFSRIITATPSGFRFDYTVRNRTDDPLPYLWCTRPLICLDPPLAIEIIGRPAVRLGNDSRLGKRGERYRWPMVRGRSFAEVGKPSSMAVKLFVFMERGEVTLHHKRSSPLQIRWPLDQLPVLGLWSNEGGWSGAAVPPYCTLGVEPRNGAPDDLAVAIEHWQSARVLPPGNAHHWWLELSFLEP
jgi:hypothetical protein